jgi:hypothetical protein
MIPILKKMGVCGEIQRPYTENNQSILRTQTAEAVYLEAKKLQPSIAVGTVYRNLRLMT